MVTGRQQSLRTGYGAEVVNLLAPQLERNVLFVDHREAIRRSFARTVTRLNVSVTTVPTVDEGLAKLFEGAFSVVLASDELPADGGFYLLDEARWRAPDAQRILVSGRTDLDAALQAINRIGLFSLIVMPWDPDVLRDKIRRACDHHALMLENKKLGNLLADKIDELKALASVLESEVQIRTTSLLVGLNAALDLRDTDTQSHSRRVALYARRLAAQCGLPDHDILMIERGSLLHDIGKIGVSDTILLKPGKLTPEEWVEMQKHAEHGYKILEGIAFLGDARELVRQHHERWDGKGYPRGLAREEICIGARIFAVIDAYDAITSDRPYRKGQSHDVALEEIRKSAGTQFDASLVAVWENIPAAEIFGLREAAQHTTAGAD
jgi:putative nucleotidyltransferase with HDIG domain